MYFYRARSIYFLIVAQVFCAVLQIAASEQVARWDFGTEERTRLTPHGGVHRDVPGPRPPEFPDFEPDNTAVKFDGAGAHFSFNETSAQSSFAFRNGDSITIEAWVNMSDSKSGENLYIIGKGRTGSAGFAKDNQNWALRIRELNGAAHASFLFATPREAGSTTKDAHFHRWTSTASFAPGSGWHRIATSYTFGDPASVRGWIDADPTQGTWDMGGETKAAPVVDDDAVWIGSSMGGSAANSFRGSLDALSLHRGILSDDVMRSRFHRVGPPLANTPKKEAPKDVALPITPLPAGKVVISLHEGLETHTAFPSNEATPKETMRFEANHFLFPRLPLRYDDWGIRQSWAGPVLLRAQADVQLAPGKHRFMLRAREVSRLWVNGVVIARTKAHSGSSDGYQPVPKVPEPPAPGMHRHGYGDQEVFADVEIPADGRCRVVLDVIVGGKKFRAEPGELCVALQTENGGSYSLLQPKMDDALPMTEDVWDASVARIEAALIALDDTHRHVAATSQDPFWEKRHAFARAWISKQQAPVVPNIKDASNAIDAFITARIQHVTAASAAANPEESKHFYGTVLPILEAACFRCHDEKKKGGLTLTSRNAALKSGVSNKIAIVPNHPETSELLVRILSKDDDERMPPNGDRLKPEQVAVLESWIKSGASWPAMRVAPEDVAQPGIVDDAAFVRRAYLDTVGVPPTETEARSFLDGTDSDKRSKLVAKLVNDPRFADAWMGYWQDILAENPSILKPSLNNSGPFRWFIHESLRDNKPMDRMATELILLRGSSHEGGSAGFGLAADNDSPFAAKGQIVGTAFLGIELQCARCHDSPYHSTKQRDLYSLAAMFARKPLTVPKTSSVPAAFFEKKSRESLIKVTLKPNESLKPEWPFAKTCGISEGDELNALMQKPDDSRERLAALVTAPQNERFAKVIVNRIWKRLIGAGIVEPAHDWEGHAPSHPELLAWLSRDFVEHGYDFKRTVATVMTSQLYQRQATGRNIKLAPEKRFFAAPERRRLAAEQVVDSLYAASGKQMNIEELTFDPESRHSADTFITLGRPKRAWEFASLSNERDRPSLSLPRAQAVTDVLEAFGWFGSRQSPHNDRETDPNVLQPGVLENSMMSTWITRASERSELAELAIRAESPETLVDAIYLRFLSRLPSKADRERFAKALAIGFDQRVRSPGEVKPIVAPTPISKVTWSTHLMPEATTVKLEWERRARAGDPADPRINAIWRETYEDFIWSVINSPEFVWMP